METTKRKSIKLTLTELGNAYFPIYQIYVINEKDESHVYRTCLSEKSAKEAVDFINRTMADEFNGAFYIRELCWI